MVDPQVRISRASASANEDKTLMRQVTRIQEVLRERAGIFVGKTREVQDLETRIRIFLEAQRQVEINLLQLQSRESEQKLKQLSLKQILASRESSETPMATEAFRFKLQGEVIDQHLRKQELKAMHKYARLLQRKENEEQNLVNQLKQKSEKVESQLLQAAQGGESGKMTAKTVQEQSGLASLQHDLGRLEETLKTLVNGSCELQDELDQLNAMQETMDHLMVSAHLSFFLLGSL